MKINPRQFDEFIKGLADPVAEERWKAVRCLATYSGAEWESSPETVAPAVEAILNPALLRSNEGKNSSFRVEVARILGHIGARSPSAVPGLLGLLQDENDNDVRLEAIRSLGKIGEGANAAVRALAQILKRDDSNDLRGEAALALARIAPSSGAATAALRTALEDQSGWVSVCAATALWRISRKPEEVVPALASRLTDPKSRDAAAQALYRIGAEARAAVPALLAAAKKNGDRLFHESVVLALRKIDPIAAVKVSSL